MASLRDRFWNMLAPITDRWAYFTRFLTRKLSSYLPVPQKFLIEGVPFFVGRFTDAAFSHQDGYAIIQTPQHEWRRTKAFFGVDDSKAVIVVVDPGLVSGVANYGTGTDTFDPLIRRAFNFIPAFFNHDNMIMNRNDRSVVSVRKEIRETLKKKDIPAIIERLFKKWLRDNEGKSIDLTQAFKPLMFAILGETVMGFPKLPQGNALEELIALTEIIDKAMTIDPSMPEVRQALRKMQEYSDWLLKQNRDYLVSSHARNLTKDIFSDMQFASTNIAVGFVATSNITKLIIQTITLLSYNKSIQERVAQALRENDKGYLDRFYQECCRTLITTLTSKYFDKDHSVTTENGKVVTIPAGSNVIIPHGRIQLSDRYYSKPETFDPDRIEFTRPDQPIKINDPLLSPFGLGARRCPASVDYTPTFFSTIIRLWTQYCKVEPLEYKDFVFPTTSDFYISLDKSYRVSITDVTPQQSVYFDDPYANWSGSSYIPGYNNGQKNLGVGQGYQPAQALQAGGIPQRRPY